MATNINVVPLDQTTPSANSPVQTDLFSNRATSIVTFTTEPLHASHVARRVSLVGNERVLSLRRTFANVVVTNIHLVFYSTCLLDPKGTDGPKPTGSVSFGVVPSTTPLMSTHADGHSINFMSTTVLSVMNQVSAVHDSLPPGIETDLAQRSIRGGHPEIFLINNGYEPKYGGAPVEGVVPIKTDFDLGVVRVQMTLQCSGMAFGGKVASMA